MLVQGELVQQGPVHLPRGDVLRRSMQWGAEEMNLGVRSGRVHRLRLGLDHKVPSDTGTLVADLDDEGLAMVVQTVRPDFLQLHGNETAKRTAEIRARFGVAVIKALPIADASDFDGIADFEDAADMLMFDARPPRDAERGGGHGTAFDWTLLNGRTFGKPWFLAPSVWAYRTMDTLGL